MIETPTLRNIWWVALWSQDLAPGQLFARRIMDEPLVFYRDEDDRPVALTDRCAHRWAQLSLGTLLANGNVACPYHGLEYDASGVCVRNPHPNYKIPPAMRVTSYPLAEKHSAIWIWMGDAPADETLIPDFSLLDADAPDPVSKRDYLLMSASWDLVTDNLLDLSHTAFLHNGVLGNEGTIDAEIIVEQQGNTVYIERAVADCEIPGLFAKMLPTVPGERVFKSSRMRWDAPGALLNDSVVERQGDPASRTGIFGVHLITPMTARRSMYHFVAVRKSPRPATEADDRAIQEQVSRARRVAFEQQDAVMILAQQARIDLAAPRKLQQTLLVVDQGAVRKQRVLSALMAAEREPASIPASS
jgi:phenylpropionate dioxygenase-like ring-hydroxylating dioxygenase large terminal subunit